MKPALSVSYHHLVSGDPDATDRPAGGIVAAVRHRLYNLACPDWRLLSFGEESEEPVIDRIGRIAIRRTPPGWFAQTAVTGAMNTARGAALERLARYARGENRAGRAVLAVRPVVQQALAADRWLVRIGLSALDNLSTAPAPLGNEVDVVALESETIAALQVPGRPTLLAIADAESAILKAVSTTSWRKTGAVRLRLHCPLAIVPLMGSFEVVMPVAGGHPHPERAA